MTYVSRLLVLLAVISLGAIVPKSGIAATPTCPGDKSILGSYGILVAGNSLTPNSSGGKYLSGALQFTRGCAFSGLNLTGGIDGNVSTTSATGTYMVNGDGTISLTMNLSDGSPTQTYIVGVSQSNHEAVGIETDGSATATIDLTPQKTHGYTYTNASLLGTFSIVCSGLAASKDDLNYVTFDGAGNLSGQNPYNVNGLQGNLPYTGTYSVLSDGTLQGSLAGSYSQFTFSGAIVGNLLEVQYIYDQAGIGEIVACTGRK